MENYHEFQNLILVNITQGQTHLGEGTRTELCNSLTDRSQRKDSETMKLQYRCVGGSI